MGCECVRPITAGGRGVTCRTCGRMQMSWRTANGNGSTTKLSHRLLLAAAAVHEVCSARKSSNVYLMRSSRPLCHFPLWPQRPTGRCVCVSRLAPLDCTCPRESTCARSSLRAHAPPSTARAPLRRRQRQRQRRSLRPAAATTDSISCNR